MLSDEFGKTKGNFEKISKEFRQIYVEAYKYRRLVESASKIDKEHIDNLTKIADILKEN